MLSWLITRSPTMLAAACLGLPWSGENQRMEWMFSFLWNYEEATGFHRKGRGAFLCSKQQYSFPFLCFGFLQISYGNPVIQTGPSCASGEIPKIRCGGYNFMVTFFTARRYIAWPIKWNGGLLELQKHARGRHINIYRKRT